MIPNLDQQRQIFESIGRKLGVKHLDDWYTLKADEIAQEIRETHQCCATTSRATPLISTTMGSLVNILRSIYPEYPWDPSRFVGSTRGLSSAALAHRNMFEQVASQIGVNQPDEWYRITAKDILACSRQAASVLTNYYGRSVAQMLHALFPEHDWDFSKFAKAPRGFWEDLGNQRKLFDRIGKQLGVEQLDDWYKFTAAEVISAAKRVTAVMRFYNNSLIRALQAIYPEHPWQVTKFARVPNGFWKDPDNRRLFMDSIARELGITTTTTSTTNNSNFVDDWYDKVTLDDIRARGGGALISEFNGSLSRILRATYPEHAWEDDSKFVARGRWKDINICRRFFDRLGQELGVKTLDDWYGITREEVISRGGGGLLMANYGNSLVKALAVVYPDHPWDTTKFSRAPRGHWKDKAQHRAFFDRLAKELGIDSLGLDGWYNVTSADVASRKGGTSVLSYYGNSLIRALRSVYPEHPWRVLEFQKAPHSFWKDTENHRYVLDQIGKELNIGHLDDWYSVTNADVLSKPGGHSLMKQYNNSLMRALQAIYPEHAWQNWRFSGVSADASSFSFSSASSSEEDPQMGHLAECIASLARDLGVLHMDDWYRVSELQLQQLQQSGTGRHYYRYINRNGGLPLVLKRLYPHHPWDESKFHQSTNVVAAARKKKASQRWLKVTLQRLFSDADILEDYLHPDLTFAHSNQPMELDLYLPSLSLAFEYHGKQHYADVHFFGRHDHYQHNDTEKAAACKAHGITLIGVPYWWDSTAESLVAMIRAVRPDLFSPPSPPPAAVEQQQH